MALATSADHLSRFLATYFSHKYFAEVADPWIRLSLIPSRALKARQAQIGKKGTLKNNPDEVLATTKVLPRLVAKEYVLYRSNVSDALIEKLLGHNEPGGFDIYYFANAVDRGCKNYARDENVVDRLWIPVDLDFKLPCSWEEMCDEFGLKPSLVVSTSKRQGFPRHQILWGIEYEYLRGKSANREAETAHELKNLARSVGACFCSDNISDAKRILRLPGTINWKGAQVDGSGGSEAELIYGAEQARVYSVEEFEEAVKRFERSELSRELEKCGFKEVRLGGRAAGERGEFGSWEDVLSAAQGGNWSVGEGGRHNALCSWGVQMAAARLPWAEVEKRLGYLRDKGLEGGYDDEEDYQRIVRGVKRKWEEIDSEVDAALDSVAIGSDLSHCEIGENGARSNSEEQSSTSFDNSGDNNSPGGGESAVVGSGGGISPSNPDIHESINPWDYSVRLARQAEGETEAHWLDFLGNCLAAAIEFERSDTASVVPLGRILWGRLLWCGALRDGGYWAPVQHREPFKYWGFERLGDDAAKILIKDFLYQVSRECNRKRKKLETHPAVMAQNRGKKKPSYVFPGLGGMEVKAVNDVFDRAAAVGSQEVGDDGIISFQNGWFDLGLWSLVNGDGEKEESLEEKVLRCWTPNGEERCEGIRRSVSWMRWPHTCGVNFDLESAVRWASGERVEMPKSDYFFGSAFGDNGRDVIGLMRIIGYCLLADNPCQKYFYFEGQAGTGKGTTAEIILALAGRHRAGRISAQRFESDAWLGPLEGKGPVLIDEAENVNVTQHKKMLVELARVTGESAVASRVLREDMRDIRSTQRFILTTNQNLETNDESGQQARRIVPLNFRYVPKKGPIPGLWRQIVREEGARLATVGTLELARVWGYQDRLFSVGLEEAAAFSRGRERFKAVSRGLGDFITKIIGPGKGLSSALLRSLCQLWINQEKDRSWMSVGLHLKVNKEMDSLGYDSARITYPMSETGVLKHTNRGTGYAELDIKVSVLLDELGMNEPIFVQVFTELVGAKSKEWFAAESLLELEDRSLWSRNAGEDSWMNWDNGPSGNSDLNL